MKIDLTTEDGRIFMSLAGIGMMVSAAMRIDTTPEQEDRCNREIGAMVYAFQESYSADRVRQAMEKVALWVAHTSLS